MRDIQSLHNGCEPAERSGDLRSAKVTDTEGVVTQAEARQRE